jgi:hypothetical protein
MSISGWQIFISFSANCCAPVVGADRRAVCSTTTATTNSGAPPSSPDDRDGRGGHYKWGALLGVVRRASRRRKSSVLCCSGWSRRTSSEDRRRRCCCCWTELNGTGTKRSLIKFRLERAERVRRAAARVNGACLAPGLVPSVALVLRPLVAPSRAECARSAAAVGTLAADSLPWPSNQTDTHSESFHSLRSCRHLNNSVYNPSRTRALRCAQVEL